jgi:hypothetical protein
MPLVLCGLVLLLGMPRASGARTPRPIVEEKDLIDRGESAPITGSWGIDWGLVVIIGLFLVALYFVRNK